MSAPKFPEQLEAQEIIHFGYSSESESESEFDIDSYDSEISNPEKVQQSCL